MLPLLSLLLSVLPLGHHGVNGGLIPPPPTEAPAVYDDPLPPADYGVTPEVIYNSPLTANDNGYGKRDPNCHIEEKVVFEDKCEPYPEKLCYTQNVEECKERPHKNCTGTIKTDVDRKCFNVKELICNLKERIDYETHLEEYKVQKCTVVKDRVCDTTFHIDVNPRDDFQCCNVESERCEVKDVVINDVTCKNTFEFDCAKEKRTDGGYGREMVCRKTPKENCYKTPRTIHKEVCRQQTERYCQKFTNPHPRPVEKQNCHFEPKKVCELETRSRPRKSKRYSYSPDCKVVPRELCDQTEKKTVVPACVTEHRLTCDYTPVTKCHDEEKKYCWKVEKKVQEEVCDKKFFYFF